MTLPVHRRTVSFYLVRWRAFIKRYYSCLGTEFMVS